MRSHYDLVRPLLKRYGLTGTFFIPASRTLWLHAKTEPSMREEGLSWPQLRQMHQEGFEMANHTADHLPLTELSDQAIVAQIGGLDNQFEAQGLPRPVSLAFPGYWCDQRVVDSIKSTQIRFARTGYVDGDLLPNHHTRRPSLRHYCPKTSDPLPVYCTGILNDSYTTDTFIADLEATPQGNVAIFAAHGFRLTRRWSMFEQMVNYVVKRDYQTLRLNQLPIDSRQRSEGPTR